MMNNFWARVVVPLVDKVILVVKIVCGGHQIDEFALVSQLNGNLFLYKDILTLICISIYFNNSNDYISTTLNPNTCMLGLRVTVRFFCAMLQQTTNVHGKGCW